MKKKLTSKPYINEMRIFNGVLKVWSGSSWITEPAHAKQWINSIFK